MLACRWFCSAHWLENFKLSLAQGIRSASMVRSRARRSNGWAQRLRPGSRASDANCFSALLLPPSQPYRAARSAVQRRAARHQGAGAGAQSPSPRRKRNARPAGVAKLTLAAQPIAAGAAPAAGASCADCCVFARCGAQRPRVLVAHQGEAGQDAGQPTECTRWCPVT